MERFSRSELTSPTSSEFWRAVYQRAEERCEQRWDAVQAELDSTSAGQATQCCGGSAASGCC